MYADTEHFLVSAGYHRYEISNFARNDEARPLKYESRHNITYWTRGDYLGFGIGASSMIENERFSNIRDLETYIEAKGDMKKLRTGHTKLDLKAQIEEYMFLGLRMSRGISPGRFEETFRVSMRDLYGAVIDALIAQDLLYEHEGNISLTPRGVDVSNTVMAQFLMPDDETEEDGHRKEEGKS